MQNNPSACRDWKTPTLPIPVALNDSSNYQTKTGCCQTEIVFRKCYWESKISVVILIVLIPGSSVGTSGNGSVGTSGRFSVTDWNTKNN